MNYDAQMFEIGADPNEERAKCLKIGGKFLANLFENEEVNIDLTMDADFCCIIGNDRAKISIFQR